MLPLIHSSFRTVYSFITICFSPSIGLYVCVCLTFGLIIYKYLIHEEMEHLVWCNYREAMECPFIYNKPWSKVESFENIQHQFRGKGHRRRESDSFYFSDVQAVLLQQQLFQKRKSILPRSFQPDVEGFDFVYPAYPKTPEERSFLAQMMHQTFPFKYLQSAEVSKMVDAVRSRNVQAGEVIIREGDIQSDYYYIVEKGVFEATIGTKVVKRYDNKGSFGELALLYDQPRAATVTAITSGILWELDRNSFRKVILGPIVERRKRFDPLLSRVAILRSLTVYDKAILVDSLTTYDYDDGDYIKSEGDVADGIYIVEKGVVLITCKVRSDEEVTVNSLTVGDCFGAFELISGSSSASYNAKANGPVTIAFAGIETLERIMEFIEDDLKSAKDEFERKLNLVRN